MSCERYWGDGVLQAERGEPDPHRDECLECQSAHTFRGQLIAALPLIGQDVASDPAWEARVWARIAQLEAKRPRRWWSFTGGVMAAAAALILWLHRSGEVAVQRDVQVVPGEVAMRSASHRVGDRIRATVRLSDEVRIYYADRLMLRCPPSTPLRGFAADGRGLVAELVMRSAGNYDVIVITAMAVAPSGELAHDLATVVTAGGEYQRTPITVD